MTRIRFSSIHPAPRPWARRFALIAAMAMFTVVLGACSTVPKPKFPEPLRAPKPEVAQEQLPEASGLRSRPRIEEGPTIVSPPIPASATAAPPEISADKPVTLSLDSVTLSAFINVVFGTELGFSLEIDQSVRQRPEVVSLRLVDPTPPERLYAIGQEVLARYGVQITRGNEGVLHFGTAAADGTTPPRLITARALPNVPAGERPVFVAMPLNVSQPGRIAAQVRSLFGSQKDLELSEMVEANALLISGPPASVQAAMEAVAVLDRVSLRDKHSLRINPLYVSADVLADELRDVLGAQGYAVRSGPGSGGVLALVPVASANALIIFSESEPALAAARDWVERLDQPSDDSAGNGVYLYAARHTTVETLIPVLQALIGDGASGTARSTPAPEAAAAAPAAADARTGAARPASTGSGTTVIQGAAGQLAVDPIRNVIVFQGDADRWRGIRGLLARLDQPARQVVIEVTIAEITLTDEFSHGVEWALRNIGIDGFDGPVKALAGAAVNAGGIVWSPISNSGQVRAIVNLFANDSRVTILSTPRLLVKSGASASIDVGTEVPIITSQATAADLPSNNNGGSILQSIQYRKTGVLLEIQAVVHSGQQVDLELTQEVSEATQTDTSEISSPSIFSRRLQTSVSLSDGQSMLLGGLISSSRTDGASKVPGLGDIPVLGRLFQNRRLTSNRTELLMLITPYVVEDASQARAITDAIRARFGSAEQSGP